MVRRGGAGLVRASHPSPSTLRWGETQSSPGSNECHAARKRFVHKFRAWAAAVPHTIRNPLYHWTHLELKRYFNISDLLDEASAARIWKEAGERLAEAELSAQGILKKFRVTSLCTTDDPLQLEPFRQLSPREHAG